MFLAITVALAACTLSACTRAVSRVFWSNAATGTTAAIANDGRDIVIASTKYGYSLTLPRRTGGMNVEASDDTPLDLETDRYSLRVKIHARGDESPEDYLRFLYEGMQADDRVQVRNGTFLPEGTRPVFRFMMRYSSPPEPLAAANVWRWNYLTAVPGDDSWYIVQLSANPEAKADREPRDSVPVGILRTAFSVLEGEDTGSAAETQEAFEDSINPDDMRKIPECRLPDWQAEDDVTPPRRILGAPPARPMFSRSLPWVILMLPVEPTGTVGKPVICGANDGPWALAVIDSVSRWRFEPATRGGKPVAYRLILKLALH